MVQLSRAISRLVRELLVLQRGFKEFTENLDSSKFISQEPGFDRLSDFAISFHYVSGDMMWVSEIESPPKNIPSFSNPRFIV